MGKPLTSPCIRPEKAIEPYLGAFECYLIRIPAIQFIVTILIMHSVNLRSIDLNLLIVLQGVLSARHITRAARLLNMSQPAVSHALGRLRHIFRDRLLIRRGAELELTPRAREIASSLDAILLEVSHLLERSQFDPATATGQFSICATEGAIAFLLSPLLQAREAAPSVRFDISFDVSDIERRLKSGAVDLYLDSHAPLSVSEFRSTALFPNKLQCVAREGTFKRNTVFTRSEYEARAHVVIAGGTNDQITSHLRQLQITRRVAIVAPGYFCAASIVSRSDLLVTLPETLAANARELFPVEAIDLPFDLPEITLSLSWHTRTDGYSLHRWVRDIFISGAKHAAQHLHRQ